MRPIVSTLAAVLLAGSAIVPAATAEPCARPTEIRAFEVASLKSELMVVAIACQAQDRYNTFVVRFRHDLQWEEQQLRSYFARTAGHHGQQRHDNYITNLANAQSEDGLQQGTLFCQQHIGMFDEVMALPNGDGLPDYAQKKSLAQPISLSECPTAPVHKARRRVHTVSEK